MPSSDEGRHNKQLRVPLAGCLIIGFFIFAAFLPVAEAALPTPTWTQLSPATSPPARSGASLAYDSGTSQLVLFGGASVGIGVLNDTWTWDGSTWTELSPPTSPAARAYASMTYDPATGQLLLFGGQTANGAVLGDTWIWNGTTWTQLSPATSPSARAGASIAYDSATSQLLLFGGNIDGSVVNDTWIWNGTTWMQLTPATSPAARSGASMAYDPTHTPMLLFGGIDNSSVQLNDTWAWSGSNWSQLSPATSPSARVYASMTYDGQTGQLIEFGGIGSAGVLNDTWIWDWGGSTWTQLSPLASPSPRELTSLANDVGTEQEVLFGGAGNGGNLNDTYEYQLVSTVTFNSDGGEAVASISGPANSSITLPSATYAGHTFDGWFTQSSGGTRVGGAGSSFTIPFGGTNLFAQWTAVAPPPPPPAHGYWLVGSDGGIFAFGSAQFYGSMGGIALQRPVVGIVSTRDRGGYWLDASDGGVFSFGETQFYGSIPGLGLNPAGSGKPNSLNAPIVGMVSSHDQGGYFMVASDGGVFAFGDAHFAGSCPGIGGCAGAAVAVMPDASGNGYWLVTASGNVYAFGDAPNLGAPGEPSTPVTSAVATPDGGGYYILTMFGQVFTYGDAHWQGNVLSRPGEFNPFSAVFVTSDNGGYWVSDVVGDVFTFGDAPNDGSMAGTHLNGSIIAASGS